MPTTETARFILEEATALGIHVGTDGSKLIMIAPLKMPREDRVWFETQLNEFRRDVITIIQNGGGS
jgi:hypothetical protein